MLWFILTSTALMLGLWVRWQHKHRYLLQVAKTIPGPPTLPGLGNALQFICKPEELILVIKEFIRDYGSIVKFWLGPDLNIILTDPYEIKDLLTNYRTSYKGPQYKYMEDGLGGGLLSGSGPMWRTHRKIATPNYGKQSLRNYGKTFNGEVGILLEKLRAMPTDKEFDFYTFIVQTTSYSACQALMGLTRDQTFKLPHLQEIIDETPVLYDIVFDRMTKWYLQIYPVFRMSRHYQRQSRIIGLCSEFSKQILKYRMEYLDTLTENFKKDHMSMEEDTQLSVIDRFILSGAFESEELLQETFTIFTTSQEASGKITSFLLLMMGYYPKCQERLYDEILRIIGDEDRDVTDEDLKNMPYLDMVFKEVLRLFPIGAILQRTITEDIPMRKGVLPAGCSLVIPVYHLHRDPRFWENGDSFDPERFMPENIKKRNPYCYIPFSMGPMDCLGRNYAEKIIKTICVRVLREFEVVTRSKYEEMRVIISISVVSVGSYFSVFIPRNKNK